MTCDNGALWTLITCLILVIFALVYALFWKYTPSQGDRVRRYVVKRDGAYYLHDAQEKDGAVALQALETGPEFVIWVDQNWKEATR